MNWFDFAILAVIGLSTLIGIWRGFVREALSLGGWVLAFWLAFTFSAALSEWMAGHIGDATLRYVIAFAVILVVVLILAGVLTALIGTLVDATGLKGTDRSIGLIFGAARGALLVAIVVLLASLTTIPQEAWWQSSRLVGPFTEMAAWLHQWLPDELAGQLNLDTALPAPPLEHPPLSQEE